MKPINDLLDAIRLIVRSFMRRLAKGLDSLTGGRLHPNVVTFTGLLAHIPITWLIATTQHNVWAAVLLIVFGLFDALDGELARLQKRASNAGMLLDATTDRMKEIILYVGIVLVDPAAYAAVTVAACGGSLLVSYVKAKGETAVAGKLPANEVNRLFQDGLMRYEIRMFLLVAGLFTGELLWAVCLIAVSSWLTAISRLIKISRRINNV